MELPSPRENLPKAPGIFNGIPTGIIVKIGIDRYTLVQPGLSFLGPSRELLIRVF